MKRTTKVSLPVWVTVRMIRGYIVEAKPFENLYAARRVENRWKRKCNPDYDEVNVVQSWLKLPMRRFNASSASGLPRLRLSSAT